METMQHTIYNSTYYDQIVTVSPLLYSMTPLPFLLLLLHSLFFQTFNLKKTTTHRGILPRFDFSLIPRLKWQSVDLHTKHVEIRDQVPHPILFFTSAFSYPNQTVLNTTLQVFHCVSGAKSGQVRTTNSNSCHCEPASGIEHFSLLLCCKHFAIQDSIGDDDFSKWTCPLRNCFSRCPTRTFKLL